MRLLTSYELDLVAGGTTSEDYITVSGPDPWDYNDPPENDGNPDGAGGATADRQRISRLRTRSLSMEFGRTQLTATKYSSSVSGRQMAGFRRVNGPMQNILTEPGR